jgi:hypothetical protein
MDTDDQASVPAYVIDTPTLRWLHDTQVVGGTDGVSLSDSGYRDLLEDGKHIGVRQSQYQKAGEAWVTWAVEMKDTSGQFVVQQIVREDALADLTIGKASQELADALTIRARAYVQTLGGTPLRLSGYGDGGHRGQAWAIHDEWQRGNGNAPPGGWAEAVDSRDGQRA